MLKPILTFAALMFGTAATADDFSVSLMAPWDGVEVPAGQQCRLFDGGDGVTPPIVLSGLPEGTVMVHVEFNDKSYAPLSQNGGHGIIGFMVNEADVTLPAVPGMSTEMPIGAFIVKAARSTGRYASDGYLPPCSGGRGNRYSADVIAFDVAGVELGSVTVELGRY